MLLEYLQEKDKGRYRRSTSGLNRLENGCFNSLRQRQILDAERRYTYEYEDRGERGHSYSPHFVAIRMPHHIVAQTRA